MYNDASRRLRRLYDRHEDDERRLGAQRRQGDEKAVQSSHGQPFRRRRHRRAGDGHRCDYRYGDRFCKRRRNDARSGGCNHHGREHRHHAYRLCDFAVGVRRQSLCFGARVYRYHDDVFQKRQREKDRRNTLRSGAYVRGARRHERSVRRRVGNYRACGKSVRGH